MAETKPTFADDLLRSATEAVAIAEGRTPPARQHHPVDVASIRHRQRLTQKAFASTYGLSVATVRDWEQGRRLPDAAARLLLHLIDRDPERVAGAAAEVSASRDVAAE